MNLNQFIRINFIAALIFLVCASSSIAVKEPVEEILQDARKQFYAAIEDKKQIEPAIEMFQRIAQREPKYAGRAQVYIGALVTLKGKHAFLPHTKLKWANRGLEIMDTGLEKNPDDIEALFIHGATCYHLPFFFRRGDDAQRDFKKIIKLMPQCMDAYDPKLMKNVVLFLLENAKLTDNERAYLWKVARLEDIGMEERKTGRLDTLPSFHPSIHLPFHPLKDETRISLVQSRCYRWTRRLAIQQRD